MSIKAIGRAMAKELMETREYQLMTQKKKELYAHRKLSNLIKDYEAKQVQITRTATNPEKRQSLMAALNKEYQALLMTKEMKAYHKTIEAFQKRTFAIFDELNEEIGRMVNR